MPLNGVREDPDSVAGVQKLAIRDDKLDDSERSDLDDDKGLTVAAGGDMKIRKKKKKKPKRKAKPREVELGPIPPEVPPPPPETPAETAKWTKLLSSDLPKLHLPPWGLLDDRCRQQLDIFLTPSCRTLELVTPRLRLRQVQPGDTTGIRRIKMEPIVQRTQMYGSPSISQIKDVFQARYVRSSMPRLGIHNPGVCRDEYDFAITALDPSSLVISPSGQIKPRNRIENAEGYLGNIALTLQPLRSSPSLLPKKGKPATHPTFAQCSELQLTGRLFYEIHPQLWGQGIMSEAFREVLRFAFEEVGCMKVISDPTDVNTASIKLCLRNGMRYTETSTDNDYGKPQLFHEITREEWFARNRPQWVTQDQDQDQDHWGGKEVCRWCLNFRLAPPTICCSLCDWAKYCSRECQRADWLRLVGGHQSECTSSGLLSGLLPRLLS